MDAPWSITKTNCRSRNPFVRVGKTSNPSARPLNTTRYSAPEFANTQNWVICAPSKHPCSPLTTSPDERPLCSSISEATNHDAGMSRTCIPSFCAQSCKMSSDAFPARRDCKAPAGSETGLWNASSTPNRVCCGRRWSYGCDCATPQAAQSSEDQKQSKWQFMDLTVGSPLLCSRPSGDNRRFHSEPPQGRVVSVIAMLRQRPEREGVTTITGAMRRPFYWLLRVG